MGKNRIIEPPPLQGAKVVLTSGADDLTPVWCFKHLVKGYTFSDVTDRADQRRLLDGIERRRDRTWRQLLTSGPITEGVVFWDVKHVKKPLPATFRSESQIVKFYVGGKGGGRIIGFRDERCLQVVWIDFKLDVTDH